MLQEGDEIRQIVTAGKLRMPVLAVDAGTGAFTYDTMSQVAENVTDATSPASATSLPLRIPSR